MNARELTLNIATNLGRISRWAYEGRTARIPQFMEETEKYLSALKEAPKNPEFQKTFARFQCDFAELKRTEIDGDAWAERALTWANILTHRAKLASDWTS